MHVRTLIPLAALAVALAVPRIAHAQPVFVPDGTYEYVLRQGVTTVATSTITVKRSGNVIGLREAQTVTETQVGNVTLSADEALVAESLEPLSFGCTTVASGKTQEVKFAYSNGAGYFTQNGERLTVPVRMLPGTQAMIVQDQTLVLSFLTLPGVVNQTHAANLTVVVPTASRMHMISVDPAAQTRPSGVPANDAGVGVAAGNASIAFSVWYDPRSGVIDEIDIPSQSLVIVMTKRS